MLRHPTSSPGCNTSLLTPLPLILFDLHPAQPSCWRSWLALTGLGPSQLLCSWSTNLASPSLPPSHSTLVHSCPLPNGRHFPVTRTPGQYPEHSRGSRRSAKPWLILLAQREAILSRLSQGDAGIHSLQTSQQVGGACTGANPTAKVFRVVGDGQEARTCTRQLKGQQQGRRQVREGEVGWFL